MIQVVIGFAIWAVLGFGGWHFSSYLKAFAIRAALITGLCLLVLVGITRFLLQFLTNVAKAVVEVLMLVVSAAAEATCRLFPEDQQQAWSHRCAVVTLWAKTRAKTILADDEDKAAAEPADDQARVPEEPQERVTAYEWALKVMGLEDEAELTLPKLKQRYRQMISVIHPDKQFPSQVFAQQVNDALKTIKRQHGWQ